MLCFKKQGVVRTFCITSPDVNPVSIIKACVISSFFHAFKGKHSCNMGNTVNIYKFLGQKRSDPPFTGSPKALTSLCDVSRQAAEK